MTDHFTTALVNSHLIKLMVNLGPQKEVLKALIAEPFSHTSPGIANELAPLPDMAIKMLSTQLSLVLHGEAQRYWNSILTWAHMAQFYASFDEEAKIRSTVRLSQYPYVILTVRNEPIGRVKTDLANELYHCVPQLLRPFLGTETLETASTKAISQTRKQKLYRFHRTVQRWHKIISVVGWVGVFLGHIIPPTVFTHYSDLDFEKFLGAFSIQRPKIFDLVDRHWPEAPKLIKMIGGLHSLLHRILT